VRKPYGIISDTHHHSWSAFSTTLPSGINSRLAIILGETHRAADAVFKAGGDTLVHAGDLFHVRGSVAPSVLNPTLATYKMLVDAGLKIIINAGNHDLEGREATDVGSAITALKEVGCTIINKPTVLAKEGVALCPYIGKVSELKAALENLQDEMDAPNCDLIVHAGIDGVIKGLPDHGLDADYLAKLKFVKTFAGHYHHHKELYPKRVWSIGALTHQTWGDVGTKAGFLVVYPEGQVKWFASHAPSFVDIDATTKPDDIPLIVDGNYVRAKITSSKQKDIEDLRQFLIDNGAKGVTIVSQPATGVTRTASTVKAGASLEVSVNDYITGAGFGRVKELAVLCGDILKEAREAA
jgi:DNA repair exonuclease SbcCD nuclease subunit